jgi:hypothetical protein
MPSFDHSITRIHLLARLHAPDLPPRHHRPTKPSHLLHSGHKSITRFRPYQTIQVRLTLISMPVKRCPRCSAEIPTRPWPPKPGRPAVWCSQRCRRAAYEERRAARSGAMAVRIEIVEKPVERIIDRVRIVTREVPPSPAEAARIVLKSPRACRTVLESLAAEMDSGQLDIGAHGPTLRAAQQLLTALRRARLLDG